MLIVACIIIYSVLVIFMIIGVEINKTFLFCFECILESLFHPCSCIVETWLACSACIRPTVRPVVDWPVVPPPKEIEMIVIINPGGMPLQIGQESV